MARPIKHGLDYFPMNVDFFEDDKIQFVSSRFDEKGELIAIKLLCKIFRSGYYISWNEDAALLFAKGAGKNISPSLVNDVVYELIKRDFFHRGLFERFSILTSNGIQKRYIKICIDAKRKDWKIDEKYDVTLFTQEETKLTTEETGLKKEEGTQRKEKESKEKKRILNTGADALRFEKKLILNHPFSEKFLDAWIAWKNYKKVEHRFLYKSIETEQATITKLVHDSGGSEEVATKMIYDSIARNWRGIFKDTEKIKHGTHKQTSSKTGQPHVGKKSAGAARLAEELKDDIRADLQREGDAYG